MRELLLFPIRATVHLIKFLAVPAVPVALAWWLAGPGSLLFLIVAVLAALYTAAVLKLWSMKVTATSRRMTRGLGTPSRRGGLR
ncbi:hypothetical protein [Amycolatopsis sp. PS_44_ISF1]|uniref:hypothetical protein n=1 Tax=Amycolatopsis sp. PS_44_ISF1 TaxID=2974917 RepID=UPI0028DF6AAE|nr:hypothetical protein [Amycolatopsis sp. PS_44_ISF1]MDT8916229.1 hypothetical protein [Amycolatopsis sp. PS_44_ISF1]